jgi:hypothetical protein
MLVAPLLDVVRDQQHVGATSPSPATTRASTHPAQVRRTANLGDEPEEPAPLNIEPAVGDSDVNEAPLLDLDDHLDALPTVRLLPDLVPEELTPARFFDVIVRTVLANSPITFHRQARAKFAYPRSS